MKVLEGMDVWVAFAIINAIGKKKIYVYQKKQKKTIKEKKGTKN